MINHREKLLEDFKVFKEEYNSVQTELNELFHVELDNKTLSVVKEDHDQLLKDIRVGRTDLRTAYKKLAIAANMMRNNLTKVHYGMKKDLNDLLVQIKDIYEHNRLARFKHRNDLVNCEIYDVISRNKRDNKTYIGVYPSMADLNPKWVVQQVDRILADLESGNKEDLEFTYNDTMNQINQFIGDRPYSSMLEVGVKVTKYHNVKFGEAVKVMVKLIDIYYSNIAFMEKVLDQQLLFINELDQAYKMYIGRHKDNKEKMKYVDDVFSKCAEFMNKVLNYDNLILETLTQVYKKTAEQLIDLKQVLEN